MTTFISLAEKHRIVTASILGILLFAVLFFFFYGPIVGGMRAAREGLLAEWSALTLPSDLRQATFFKTSKEGIFAYTAKNFFYDRDTRVTSSAFSVARAGDSVASLENDNGVYMVRVDGTLIASSTIPFYGVTFSSDGNNLYVARAKNAGKESVPSVLSKTTSFIIDPSKFDIVRYTRVPVASKTPLFLPPANQGAGIPLTVTNDHAILSLAFGGIIRVDTQTGAGKLILPLRFDSIRMPVAVSPDHTLISWTDTASGNIEVYRISGETLEKVGTVTGVIPGRYVLANTALYELRSGTNGSVEIWKRSLDGSGQPKKVHTFPPQITIVGMTF